MHKVYSENDDKELQKEFYYTSEKDRRRPLKKDTNGHYNYVPTYSPYSPSLREQISIDEIYAKNINEINYHSLTYKTIVCRKAVCNDNYCPNAHGMEENFRIIYDYKDDKICQLMRKLMNATSLRIESYLEHFEIHNFSSRFSFFSSKSLNFLESKKRISRISTQCKLLEILVIRIFIFYRSFSYYEKVPRI